ncbi:hypothetical protein ACVWWG_003822 [Bradyrhizobium sp. LB7.2]
MNAEDNEVTDSHVPSVLPPELRNTPDLPQHSSGGLAVRMIPLTETNVVVNDGCEKFGLRRNALFGSVF